MIKVTATGEFSKRKQTVTVIKDSDKLTVLFDGVEDELSKNVLDKQGGIAPGLGNHCHPDEGTALFYYNILNTVYFDKLEKIEVEGELETIPYEEGVIY